MAYSIYRTTGDGTTTTFPISFTLGFLNRSQVRCRVNFEVDGSGDPVYRTLTWINDGLVTIGGTVPANGVDITFSRTADKTALVHDYTDDVPITEGNLDQSNKQLMYLVHEVLDGRFTSPFQQDLPMGGYKITDLGDGEDANDAVNKGQLDAVEDLINTQVPAAEAAQAAAEAAQDAAEIAEANAEAAAANAIIAAGVYAASSYGVVGDGTTNDTTAFTNLEASLTGASVNLGGRVCLVNSVPTGNDYHNGAFKVGSVVYWKFRNPRQHIFDTPTNSITSIRPAMDMYRQPMGVFEHSNGEDIVMVYAEQNNHGVDITKNFLAYRSPDFGRTIVPTTGVVTAYSDGVYSTGTSAAGQMGSGRFGIISGRTDAGGVYGTPVFVYSDDNGATWSSSTHSYGGSGLARSDFHSRIYPWPASAGGHDTNGYVAFAYAGSYGIVGWYTTDNGATWTPTPNTLQRASTDPNSEVVSFSEMSVARVGTQNKWVMIGRTGVDSAFVSTSTDLVTWTSAKLIPNLNLRGNPPEIIYEDGKLLFFALSREGSKEILPAHSNALVVSAGEPNAIFASQGKLGWTNWQVINNLPFWPTGYIKPVKLRDRWYFYFCGGEDFAGGSTGRTGIMYLLSNDIAETTTTKQMLRAIPAPNFFPPGQFTYWPCGTSFASNAGRQQVLPGMTFARQSGVSGATFSRQAGDAADYCMRIRRDDGNTGTQTINALIVLTAEDSALFRENRVAISFRARCGSGFSAASKFLFFRARSSADPEQIVTSTSGTMSGDTVVASSNVGVTLTTNWMPYSIATGPFALTANQIMLQIFWTPVGTASEDWIDIELLKVEIGNDPTPLEMMPRHTLRAWCERFYQAKTVQTQNGARHIPFVPMHRIPTVTASAGTVSSITTDGLELTHTSATASNIVANAFL